MKKDSLGKESFIMKELGKGINKDANIYNKNLTQQIYEANKLYTIINLYKHKEEMNIEELCLATTLVILEEENIVSHFLIPEIKNATNLGLILKDKTVSDEKKINYLYQVGKIIDKIINLNLDIKINIGDVREYNFIIDQKDKIHIVDTDSFYLHTNYPVQAYYLPSNVPIIREQPKKYKMKISDDTDIFCYISMIFNTLINNKIHLLDKESYFLYLDYLKYLGFGIDILMCFQKVYLYEDNKNPYHYLEQIPLDKLKETDTKSYKKYRRKKNLF